uniref:Uncharacterized protein n=1 Tax=Arundo donax TaxID=35708 RepID=A0A0A9EX98_ARUDO
MCETNFWGPCCYSHSELFVEIAPLQNVYIGKTFSS